MSKLAEYRQTLRTLPGWEAYLLRESGLPGPRGNLELLEAAFLEGGTDFFDRCLLSDPDGEDSNDPKVFLMMCGVVGLGKRIAAGEPGLLPRLRPYASDPRWRVREAVAIAFQHWGDADLPGLLAELEGWSNGSRYEQRAVVAGICEPRLLKDPAVQRRALALLDCITDTLLAAADRKTDGFIALRKALAYGWSVAVAASPTLGQPIMQVWLSCTDADVSWVMRENLKKNRIKGLTWRA